MWCVCVCVGGGVETEGASTDNLRFVCGGGWGVGTDRV